MLASHYAYTVEVGTVALSLARLDHSKCMSVYTTAEDCLEIMTSFDRLTTPSCSALPLHIVRKSLCSPRTNLRGWPWWYTVRVLQAQGDISPSGSVRAALSFQFRFQCIGRRSKAQGAACCCSDLLQIQISLRKLSIKHRAMHSLYVELCNLAQRLGL